MVEKRETGGKSGKDERAERLAAALRENLRRRKAQARGLPLDEDGESQRD
ncbi:MAG: hypothetical protein ACTHMG_05050 [Sphingomonas sp.]